MVDRYYRCIALKCDEPHCKNEYQYKFADRKYCEYHAKKTFGDELKDIEKRGDT